MSSLDDLTLIQRFVQGKTSLEANSNLRVESVVDTVQLFTKRGSFLAAVKLALNIRSALVRQESQYWEVISQSLVEHNFIPTGVTEQGLMRYEHQSIPEGYKMQYTEARSLWRNWRKQLQQKPPHLTQPQPTQLKIMLYTSNKGWQRVQHINTSQELLFVETLADEVMIHSGDRIAWLKPVEEFSSTQIPDSPALSAPKSSQGTPEPLQGLSNIIQMREGKLYVQTAHGEVVVEGVDLRFHIQETKSDILESYPVCLLPNCMN